MNNKLSTKNEIQDVPKKIFEKFIEELKNTGVSLDVVERLEDAILSEDIPSEQSLKKALFSNTESI